MTDKESPPPRPKPGSLRDRIAAFETKPAATGPAPPAPRPKPGHVQWKPAPRVSDEAGDSASNDQPVTTGSHGSMSAADAKQSIGAGVSLKDRMAALQGKGAFGAPAPAPPKPLTEKPKWKPPPVVSPPAEENEDKDIAESEEHPNVVSMGSAPEAQQEKDTSNSNVEPEEAAPDEEEEEKQRRARLAERMARLGGARIGFAPPVIGRKPDMKKPKETDSSPSPSTASIAGEGEPKVGTLSSDSILCKSHPSILAANLIQNFI